MNCKNCNLPLIEGSNYCNSCGAKVVNTRITMNEIISQFITNVFGWDNRFFRTLRYLLLVPNTILEEYLNGSRKKYSNPFSFFTLSTTISLIVINLFSDQYLEFYNFGNEAISIDKSSLEFYMNYYFLFSFLFLPL